MDNDKASAIRTARAQLRAAGKPESLNRVVAIVRSSKRTVQKYWSVTDPVDEGPPAPASAPVPAPVPVPPAPEPPAFSLENLRRYYLNRFDSPWPNGVTPPVEAYPVLQALRREWDAEMGTADRQRYDVMNRLAAARTRDIDHHHEMRDVNTRRGVARLMIHSIQSDMSLVRMHAHDRGIELPDPRLS